MKNLLTATALVMALALLMPASASAQASGQVSVSITVNGVVILYYYDNVTINIPSSVMTQLMGTNASNANSSWAIDDAAYVNATTITVDANSAPEPGSTPTLPTGITLNIQNAWSVRTLMGGTGSVEVTATANAANLVGAVSGDPIAVGGAACSGTCTISGPQGLTASHSGGVDLTGLNFSGVTEADTFTASPAYTVTATIT